MKYILPLLFLFTTVLFSQKFELSPYIDKGLFNSNTLFNLKSDIGTDSLFIDNPEINKTFVASELTYPTDYLRIGLSGKVFLNNSHHIKGGIWVNIIQPQSPMIDEDWYGVESDNMEAKVKFSNTESTSEGYHFGATTGYGGQTTVINKPVDIYINYQVDYFNFEAKGLQAGWQNLYGMRVDITQEDLLSQSPPITSNTTVLTYWALHQSILIGAEFPLKKFGIVELRVGLNGGPAYSFDHDNHPLRGKVSNSQGFGISIGSLLAMRIALSENMSMDIGMYPQYHYTKGSMTQEWYRTESSSGESVEKGTIIEDIDAEMIYFNKPLRLQFNYLIM
ncbi:MAG: hypothetical protein OCD01_13680 [Fibrobacterales bacterium]